MSRGLPDYYHGIDVTYQTLSELINRPKYGSAGSSLAGGVAVNPETEEVLCSVVGKGIIYAGFMYAEGDVSIASVYFRIYIDGTRMTNWDLNDFEIKELKNIFASALYLKAWDTTNHDATVLVTPGITFEQSVETRVYAPAGVTLAAAGELTYALI